MYGRFVPAGAKKETHSVNYFLRFEYFIMLIAVKKKKKKGGGRRKMRMLPCTVSSPRARLFNLVQITKACPKM